MNIDEALAAREIRRSVLGLGLGRDVAIERAALLLVTQGFGAEHSERTAIAAANRVLGEAEG